MQSSVAMNVATHPVWASQLTRCMRRYAVAGVNEVLMLNDTSVVDSTYILLHDLLLLKADGTILAGNCYHLLALCLQKTATSSQNCPRLPKMRSSFAHTHILHLPYISRLTSVCKGTVTQARR